jgi:TctA family transporter
VRRALRVANGDLSVFVHRPASAGLLVLACLVLAAFSLPGLRPRVAEPD